MEEHKIWCLLCRANAFFFFEKSIPLDTDIGKILRDLSKGGGQWHNSRGQSAPWHFSLQNFCWPTRKREARKKAKTEKKRTKIENWKWEEKFTQWGEDLFFLFIFFTFQNHWNLFWVYQNGNFLPGKSISHRGKSGKMTLTPLKNIPLMQGVEWVNLGSVKPIITATALKIIKAIARPWWSRNLPQSYFHIFDALSKLLWNACPSKSLFFRLSRNIFFENWRKYIRKVMKQINKQTNTKQEQKQKVQ